MVGTEAVKPYQYVHCYRDRHGKVRYYYRRDGKQTPIPHVPGTIDFQIAYDALHRRPTGTAAPSLVAPTIKHGTLRWLCVQYFGSMDFSELDPETQRVRRRVLESVWDEPWEPGSSRTFGDAPLAALTPHAVAVLRDRKKGLPEAARARLKGISRVFDWAMRPESNIKGITSNPAKAVRRPQENVTGGYHSWTPEEVLRYEQRHPIGTKVRLALGLFLFTGQRKCDVVLFGRQHIRGGVLTFTQQKNRNRNPVKLELPVLVVLQKIIDASPCGHLTFLVTEFGKPFTAKGFGSKFLPVRRSRAPSLHCPWA